MIVALVGIFAIVWARGPTQMVVPPSWQDSFASNEHLMEILHGSRKISPVTTVPPSSRRSAERDAYGNAPKYISEEGLAVRHHTHTVHHKVYKNYAHLLTDEKISHFKESQSGYNQQRRAELGNYYDTVVVGTGVAGLSTGATTMTYAPLAAPEGHSILLIDKNDVIGGVSRPTVEYVEYTDENGVTIQVPIPVDEGYQGTANFPGIDTLFGAVMAAPPDVYRLSADPSPSILYETHNGALEMAVNWYMDMDGCETVGCGLAQSLEIALGLRAEELITFAIHRAAVDPYYYTQIPNIVSYINDVGDEIIFLAMGLPRSAFDGMYMNDYFATKFPEYPVPVDLQDIITDVSQDDGHNAIRGPMWWGQAVLEMIYATSGLMDFRDSALKITLNMIDRIRDYGGVIKTNHELMRVNFDDAVDPMKATSIIVQKRLGNGGYHEPETVYFKNLVLTLKADLLLGGDILPQHVKENSVYDFPHYPYHFTLAEYLEKYPVRTIAPAVYSAIYSQKAETLGMPMNYHRLNGPPYVTWQETVGAPRPTIEECGPDKFATKSFIARSLRHPDIVGDMDIAYVSIFTYMDFGWFREWENSTRTSRPNEYKRFRDECLMSMFREVLHERFPGTKDTLIYEKIQTPLDLHTEYDMVEGAVGSFPPEHRIYRGDDGCGLMMGSSNVYLQGAIRDIGFFLDGSHGLQTGLAILVIPVFCGLVE